MVFCTQENLMLGNNWDHILEITLSQWKLQKIKFSWKVLKANSDPGAEEDCEKLRKYRRYTSLRNVL